MKEIIDKLLEEVDPDIKELMNKEAGGWCYWALLPNPTGTILEWQAMREHRKP